MDLSPVLSVTVILSVDRQCYPTPGHTEVHSSGHDACVNTGKRSHRVPVDQKWMMGFPVEQILAEIFSVCDHESRTKIRAWWWAQCCCARSHTLKAGLFSWADAEQNHLQSRYAL